jgi:hypothetical protein
MLPIEIDDASFPLLGFDPQEARSTELYETKFATNLSSTRDGRTAEEKRQNADIGTLAEVVQLAWLDKLQVSYSLGTTFETDYVIHPPTFEGIACDVKACTSSTMTVSRAEWMHLQQHQKTVLYTPLYVMRDGVFKVKGAAVGNTATFTDLFRVGNMDSRYVFLDRFGTSPQLLNHVEWLEALAQFRRTS